MRAASSGSALVEGTPTAFGSLQEDLPDYLLIRIKSVSRLLANRNCGKREYSGNFRAKWGAAGRGWIGYGEK